MSKNNKVLVLSEDEARRRDLVTILEFVGEEQVIAGDEALALLESDDDQASDSVSVAVVNGTDSSADSAIEKVCRAMTGVPVLVVGDPELKALSEDDAARVIARMEWPLNYTKFVDSLSASSSLSSHRVRVQLPPSPPRQPQALITDERTLA